MLKLSQRSVDAIDPTGKQFTVWDADLKGFGVRVNVSGSKAFVAYYRVNGRQRLVTLGRYGKLKVEQARRLAFKHISQALEARIAPICSGKKGDPGQTGSYRRILVTA